MLTALANTYRRKEYRVQIDVYIELQDMCSEAIANTCNSMTRSALDMVCRSLKIVENWDEKGARSHE